MKLMNKLTLKNLRLNKARTLVTAVGIMLSAALLTSVAAMSMTGKESLIRTQEVYSGNYSVSMNLKSYDILSTVRANRNVESAYLVEDLGVAEAPGYQYDTMPYMNITAVSKGAFDDCFSVNIVKGCLPQNSSEIVIDESVYSACPHGLDVGDAVTLEIGARADKNGNYITSANEYGVTSEAYEEAYNEVYKEKGAAADEWGIDEDEILAKIKRVDEKLVNTQTKTYTVVGVVSTISSPLESAYSSASCGFAYTISDETLLNTMSDVTDPNLLSYIGSTLYVKYTPETEADYMKNTEDILGISEIEFNEYVKKGDEAYPKQLNDVGVSFVSPNTYIIALHCDDLSQQMIRVLYAVAAVVMALVVLASVFVIKNSFAISITEKTRLYGMLASVGATKRQIRRNVLFEAFILGLFGIVPGIALGVGASALLTVIVNRLIAEAGVSGFEFSLSISPTAIVTAVLVSALTVFLSAIFTAVRASRIPPVEAIKGSSDIKIKGANTPKKLQKALKTSRLTEKLFGVGGVVAAKSLKRSKRKYRATVVSIVVSAALFISISTFIDCTLSAANRYYYNTKYTMSVWDLTENQAQSIAVMSEVKDSLIYGECFYDTDYNGNTCGVEVMAVSDELFKEIAEENGLDFNSVKDGLLLYDQLVYTDENSEIKTMHYYGGSTPKNISLLEYNYYDGSDTGNKYKAPVSAMLEEIPTSFSDIISETGTVLAFVREDAYGQIFPDNSEFTSLSYEIWILSEQNQELGDEIKSSIVNASLTDHTEIVRESNAMILIVKIFVYGFIAVISLIGLTNVFNTVSTNVLLRSKEFAALKSIGMTKREFNRMIRLETLMYGAKSLLIGIPLGVLGGLAVVWAFRNRYMLSYMFPWAAVLIVAAAVFVLLGLIMKYSVSKVNKQNIIETIRSDNV